MMPYWVKKMDRVVRCKCIRIYFGLVVNREISKDEAGPIGYNISVSKKWYLLL